MDNDTDVDYKNKVEAEEMEVGFKDEDEYLEMQADITRETVVSHETSCYICNKLTYPSSESP